MSSNPQPRTTLEAIARREAEFVLSACAIELHRVTVAKAEGVTSRMMPKSLRAYWHELERQAEVGNTEVDTNAMASWLRDVTPGDLGEFGARDAARQFLANGPSLSGDGIYCAAHARKLVETHARLDLIAAHSDQVGAQSLQDDAGYQAATVRVDEARATLSLLGEREVTWLDEVLASLDATLKPDTSPLISTGIEFLDEHLGGGWGWGWLVIVMGPAKSGKSALAINGFARAALRQGYRVMVASLEMSVRENVQRFLAAESGVPIRAQRKGDLSQSQMGALNSAGDTVTSWRVVVRVGLGTVDEICAAARVAHAKDGLDMLVVDYLQLVNNGNENRVIDLEQTTRALKLLGNQLGIVVILLSQPNNADAKSGSVGLFSGKGSGSIAADCDALIVPTRDAEDATRAGLSMPGCRHADAHAWPMGSLVFDGSRMTFRDPSTPARYPGGRP